SAAQTTIDLSRDRTTLVGLTGKVHQLSCNIKHDVPISVSCYFNPDHRCGGGWADGERSAFSREEITRYQRLPAKTEGYS
ncbi:Unknown protein, partial [Striga hermonthica]